MQTGKIQQKTIIDKIIWALTALLYASFSMFNKDPQLSTLSLAVITGIVLIIMFIMGKMQFRIETYHKTVLLFAAYCFLSSFWAIKPNEAIEKGVTICEILICMSVFYMYYSKCENNTELLLKAIMWGGYILVGYMFITLGSNVIYLALQDRLDSTVDNVNKIGLICAISLIISAYYALNNKEYLSIIFDIPTLFLLSACGSRKAFLILVLGVFFVYIMRTNTQNKAMLAFRIIIAVALVIGALYALSTLSMFSMLNARMEGLFALFTGTGEVDHSTMVREEMINVGLNVFKENPILGIGAGNARVMCYNYLGLDCYLHNNFVEVAVNGGIIGMILFYSLYFRLFRTIKINKIYATKLGNVITILIVCLLIAEYGLVSYYSKMYYFFFMTFFLYIRNYRS